MLMILAAVALLVPPAGVAASELPAGSLVRVTTRAAADNREGARAQTLIGTLGAFDERMLTLTLAGSNEKVVAPGDRILRLETLLEPSRKKTGALIGGLALGGAAVAVLASVCASDWGCEGADPVAVVAFVLVPVGIGAGLGAEVAPGNRWKEVPLVRRPGRAGDGTRFHLGLTRDRRGLAASVSLPLFSHNAPWRQP